MANKRRRDANGDEKSADTTHPARKRRIEYTESDAKLASLYNSLSDDVKSVRIDATKDLIRILKDADSQSVDRATTRLIRGLCSSRKAARIGFSIALIEVLNLTKSKSSDDVSFSLPSLIKKILDITFADATSSGKERKDFALGRLFAFQSLIESRLLFEKDVDIAQWEKVLDCIFQLATEIQSLRRECGSAIYGSLRTLAQIETLDASYPSMIMSKLHDYKLVRTPEGIAIWLAALAFDDITLPKGIWNHNDPLSSKERATVAKILRDNSGAEHEEAADKGARTGAAQKAPSFAWTIVFDNLYARHKPSKKGTEKTSDFEKFWTEAVDNGLFAASASTERKSLGLQVVMSAIEKTPAELLEGVFSPNVLRCIINQRAEKDRYLHEAARGPLLMAVARAKADPEAVPPMLRSLLSERGAIEFDKLTKTKTVEEILGKAKGDSAKGCLQVFEQLLRSPLTSDDKQADSRRRAIADMMLNMVRKRQPEAGTDVQQVSTSESPDSMPWMSLMLTLARFGFGGSTPGGQQTQPPLTDAVQETIRSRLMSCLNHVLSTRMDKEFLVPDTILAEVASIDKKNPSGFRTKADKQITKIVDQSHVTLAELHGLENKKKSTQKPAMRAFKALFALSLLQAYSGEHDIIPVLEDLEAAYRSWQKNDDASIMLVEILLSFISKQSAVYRKLAQQVFGAFASQMNADGLNSMLDILEKKESLSGQQELFENADEGEEDEEDDESVEGADDSDVEMIDGEDASDVEGVEDAEASEDGEEEDESSEDEDAGPDEELQDFEKKLAEALKTSKPGVDGEDSDSDESDMDDEQMMALEGHLTTIFKERSKGANKKKDNKDAKENIVNFKNRVLDLLLIYAKQEHANALTLDLILPMIVLTRTTTSKQISEKAFNLLQQYFQVCNKSKQLPSPPDTEAGIAVLESVFNEMRANASKTHSNACSRSALFLAKILTSNNSESYDDIADMYTELQKEWYHDPKSHIQASIFTEWTSWSIATRKSQH